MAKKVLVSGVVGECLADVLETFERRGLEVEFLGAVQDADINTGLSYMDNDICVSAIAAVGQYVRYLARQGEGEFAVLAPQLCCECRAQATRRLVADALARAGFSDIDAVVFTAEQLGCAGEGSCIADEAHVVPGQPVVGVTGSVPVLTCEKFRRVVVERLKLSGCAVVMPPIERIACERDFLAASLRWFDERRVLHVICIVPFGCLGGHAFARGQLRRLQREFPDIEVTVLDYEPSASDVNLVNRTELVVHSAKERAQLKASSG